MDRLPRDICTIVYRFVFDYNYRRVKDQYRLVWLSEQDDVYWSGSDCGFYVLFGSGLVNYRKSGQKYINVYNFNTGGRSGRIPPGY